MKKMKGKVSTEGYVDISFLADPEHDVAFTDGEKKVVREGLNMKDGDFNF